MRLGIPQLCTGLVATALAGGAAIAGPALDADPATTPTATTEPKTDPNTGAVLTGDDKEPEVEYGVGLRLRNARIPNGILNLFLDRAAGGSSNVGIGGELIRRRGNVELQLGMEFEHLTVGSGVWIEKNKPVPANEADYVLGDKDGSSLGWFTLEFTFVNHAPITKWLSFRYGGGAGLGILTGSLKHFNVVCAPGSSNSNPEPGCVPGGSSKFGGTGTDSDGYNFQQPVAYSLPPVFPVVNAIIGFQVKPMPQMTINLEGGIRTVPFFGVSAAYFF